MLYGLESMQPSQGQEAHRRLGFRGLGFRVWVTGFLGGTRMAIGNSLPRTTKG